MGNRKFNTGDAVQALEDGHYATHSKHIGRVAVIEIKDKEVGKGTDVTYVVDCSCAKTLRCKSTNLRLLYEGGIQEDQMINNRSAQLIKDVWGDKKQINHYMLFRLLDNLSLAQRKVIVLKYGLESPPMQVKDIARKYGVTRQRVESVIRMAINNLKKEKHDLFISVIRTAINDLRKEKHE